jgi:hypothetical protein
LETMNATRQSNPRPAVSALFIVKYLLVQKRVNESSSIPCAPGLLVAETEPVDGCL